MLTVSIIIGLAVLLWTALSSRIVYEGTLQLPLRGGKPYKWGNPRIARGIDHDCIFWLGPFIKFITVKQKQQFRLNFRFSTAAPSMPVIAKIRLDFSLTTLGLPQTWHACNGLSRRNLKRTVVDLLRPQVEQIGQESNWRHLQDNPEAFRRDLQARLNVLNPLAIDGPEISEIFFSFPALAAIRNEERKKRRKAKNKYRQLQILAEGMGKDIRDRDQLKDVLDIWRMLMKEEKSEKKEKKKE